MSWESTVTYYQTINREIRARLGGLHSAKCILYSVNFHEIEICQRAGDWAKSAQILARAAQSLEKAGADFIVLCTNTMHKVADDILRASSIPILHIAEMTAEELKEKHVDKVLLLGTKYTMEQDFYKTKLIANGIEVIVPKEVDRCFINRTIYEELCLGVVSDQARAQFLKIIDEAASLGAQGAMLACTEIGLLIQQKDAPMPLFDTAQIHAQKAALFALRERLA